MNDATLTDGERITLDGAEYLATQITDRVWMLIAIGKRGKPTTRHRPARIRDDGTIAVGRWV